jgi:hypothetical protein
MRVTRLLPASHILISSLGAADDTSPAAAAPLIVDPDTGSFRATWRRLPDPGVTKPGASSIPSVRRSTPRSAA